jgi:hypothetical protein
VSLRESPPVSAVVRARFITGEQAVRLQKAMPHAAVTLVPETGHMVHYFEPDVIVKTA